MVTAHRAGLLDGILASSCPRNTSVRLRSGPFRLAVSLPNRAPGVLRGATIVLS